jgi:TolA-binding protein
VAASRQGAIASAAPQASRAAAVSSERRPPLAEVPSAAPAPRDQAPIASGTAPSPSGASVDEGEFMRALRSARDNDPALAIELAREGNRRFPGRPDAPERASILIHALAAQGLSSEARGEAEDMVNRYPDSAWVREVERFTGAHRHRNIQVGPNGVLHDEGPPPTARR